MTKKVALFIADGTEETEAVGVLDILRRASLDVCVISMSGKKKVKGSHNITILAEVLLKEINFSEYDMLVFPGGLVGVNSMRKESKLIHLIKTFNKERKYLAAICAAPILLSEAGILKEKDITCYPGIGVSLECKSITNEPVTIDGNIITGRGVSDVFDFGLTLVELLLGKNKRDELASEMLYNL